jgi:ABC-2 type transport system permease protein
MRPVLALVRKELLDLRAYPLDLVNYAISPPLLVAPYLLVARLFGFDQGLVDSVAVGLLLWYWLSTLLGGVGLGLEEEMEEGMVETLLSQPISVVTLLGAKAVGTVILNLYITGAMVAWFFAFGVPLLLPWPAFLGLVLLAGVGISGFMLALAALLLLYKRTFFTYDLIQTSLGALSGITMPAQYLPRPLWVISRALPLSFGIESVRRILVGGGVGPDVAILAGLGLAYFLLGRTLLVLAERRMRTAGTTGEF